MAHARFFLVVTGALAGALAANGCTDVTGGPPGSSNSGSSGNPAGGSGGSSSASSGATGGATSSSGTGNGGTSGFGNGGGGAKPIDAGPDAIDDVQMNPCGTSCGLVELCDPDHLGVDDDCNGLVDEGCACAPGDLYPCFKGDPSFRGAPGCFDGVELCGPNGQFGACAGGVHAVPPDNCYLDDTSACHAITARPFVDVQLKPGTGLFSQNAVAGSETWTVQCPAGVNPCPAVGGQNPPDDYKPLQSGEYTVTYTKNVAGQGVQSCSYPLFVGAPGLRIELAWEHTTNDNGVDLDLHVHQPSNTQPWGVSPGVPQDCTWSNCVFTDFEPPQALNAPKWFLDPPAMPPQPVNWFQSPVLEENSCYFTPGGGQSWQALGLGCHNPRLDSDDISCDASVTDPSSPTFCVPENINIDYPPTGEWTRIGVHYYSSHGLAYDVHPTVRVFCNGALAADLGSAGYYVPEAPVTFVPADGAGFGANRFWIVADVAFTPKACGADFCKVMPVYSDAAAKTPFFTTDSVATTTFAPGYPPPP